MIVNDLSKLKDIEYYSYCDDGKGNIEIMFRISDEEQYKLVIFEKDLKIMNKLSKLGKLIWNHCSLNKKWKWGNRNAKLVYWRFKSKREI